MEQIDAEAQVNKEIERRVARAVEEHQLFIRFAHKPETADLAEIARVIESVRADFIYKDAIGLSAVGAWLSAKRMRALSNINDLDFGLDASLKAAEFFGDVQIVLEYWRLGAFDYEWFRADTRRIQTYYSFDEEHDAVVSSILETS